MVRPLPPRPSSQGRGSPRRRRPAPCGPVVVAAHCSILLLLMLLLLLLSATCLSSARRRSPRRVWPCRSDRRGPPRPTTTAAGGLVPPATATAAPVPSAHAIPRCAPRPVRCGGRPDDPRPSPTRRLCRWCTGVRVTSVWPSSPCMIDGLEVSVVNERLQAGFNNNIWEHHPLQLQLRRRRAGRRPVDSIVVLRSERAKRSAQPTPHRPPTRPRAFPSQSPSGLPISRAI